MSAAAEGSSSTTKAVTSDETSGPTLKDQQKPAAALEEDDEFEDFPVEGKPTTPFFLFSPLPLSVSALTSLREFRLAARRRRGARRTEYASVGGKLG